MSIGAGERSSRAEAAVHEDPPELDVLRRHAHHSSAFLALNQQTLHYRAPHIEGFIAYRAAGARHLIQLFEPFAAPRDQLPLLRSFLTWAHGQGRRVTAVELRRPAAELYVEHGFTANQLGASYSIDLERFTLRGTKFFKLRNKIARATRLGVTVHELSSADLDSPSMRARLMAVDTQWLRAKGRHVKELTFMVGERGGRGAPLRRVFVAKCQSQVIAYVTYSPCFGGRPGWLYDLTRRLPNAPPGTVELLFETVIGKLRAEEVRWLHLGFTPFVGLADDHELKRGSSPVLRRVARALSEHGQAIYPAHAQEAFKLKWAPHESEPEYVAFEPRPGFAAVWQLMRVTRAI